MIFRCKLAYFFFFFLHSACSNAETKKPEASKNQQPAQSPIATKTNQPLRITDDYVHALYQQYFKLSRALTEGNTSDARIASNALEAGARNLPGGTALGNAAAHVTTAATLEKQRTHFSTISNELIALVKKSGLKSGEVYVDYCPMALNDKGAYWLSPEKEIINPYFGEVMLNCGEIKETIR